MFAVIRICASFAVLRRFLIGLKISRHFLLFSEVKPKLIASHSYTFSRALGQLYVFGLRIVCVCDWPITTNTSHDHIIELSSTAGMNKFWFYGTRLIVNNLVTFTCHCNLPHILEY